jgi:hypothetical protein
MKHLNRKDREDRKEKYLHGLRGLCGLKSSAMALFRPTKHGFNGLETL